MTRRQPQQPKYPAYELIKIFPADTWASQLAETFKVSRETIRRWRNPKTTLTQWEADRYAIQIGKHPSEIWTNWFD
jgi:plasmid maintenance system antidote protein VapI